MKYLITGGCGFLGTNLAAEVLRRGQDLTVLDNLSRTGAEDNRLYMESLGDFDFHSIDIRDAAGVAKLVRETRPDVVFHLAGQVAMTTSLADPRADFEINALGTLNVLEAARQFAPEAAVVFSSTNKVYGDLEWAAYEETDSRYVAKDFPDGFPESIPLDFHSPYGCSKGSADQYMLDYSRMYDLKTVVFRHSSMYGGRQYSTVDQGWIGWFCSKAVEAQANPLAEPFTISGSGKQVRDVLHADDMVRLYFAAAGQIESARGQAFNIGGGARNSLSLLELFELLDQETGAKLSFTQLPPRESDQRVFIANIDKAKRLLGWEPQVGCREGIRSMLSWIHETIAR